MNDDFKCTRLISREIASVNMFYYRRSVFVLSLTLNGTPSNRLVVVTMFKTCVGFTVPNWLLMHGDGLEDGNVK